jgi:hypothetical protein
MQFAQPNAVSRRIGAGQPVPVNVRDADRSLLFERGAWVDREELKTGDASAEIDTAKLNRRAGRQMFMQDPGHPMTAALAKGFGVYPPGCHVALVTGELGAVIQRGATRRTRGRRSPPWWPTTRCRRVWRPRRC